MGQPEYCDVSVQKGSWVPVKPSPRRTQAQRRAVAEASLLAAAVEVIVEGGVRGLTLARVGERAGYSRGSVSHHFGSKRGLMETLSRESQAGFVSHLDEMAPGLERFLAHIDGYVLALGDNTLGWQAFVRLWVEAASDAELAPIMRERDASFRADLRNDVATGLAEGVVHRDVDPAAVAVAAVGQVRGIGLQRLLDPAAVDLAEVRRALRLQWNRSLLAQE
jgi:AcrR family transcriptional regulator